MAELLEQEIADIREMVQEVTPVVVPFGDRLKEPFLVVAMTQAGFGKPICLCFRVVPAGIGLSE